MKIGLGEVELGSEAITYMRSRLHDDWYEESFGKIVENELRGGRVFTLVRKDAAPLSVEALDQGRHSMHRQSLEWLIERCTRLASNTNADVLAMLSDLQRRSDPLLGTFDQQALAFAGDRVFHMIDLCSADHESARMSVARSYNHWGIGVIASRSDVTKAIRIGRWDGLVGKVSGLVVSAFDGEGYLLWERSGGSHVAVER